MAGGGGVNEKVLVGRKGYTFSGKNLAQLPQISVAHTPKKNGTFTACRNRGAYPEFSGAYTESPKGTTGCVPFQSGFQLKTINPVIPMEYV